MSKAFFILKISRSKMGHMKCSSLFLFFAFICCEIASSSSNSSNHICPHDEKSALLQFKKEFTVLGENGYPKTFSKIFSWRRNDIDCCLWDGVTCDEDTGHVIELDLSYEYSDGIFHPNSSVFDLNHLQSLNLAGNNFHYSHIPPAIGRFKYLTHLDLHMSNLSGPVPSEIYFQSRLVSLDLSLNNDMMLEEHDFKSLLRNLTHLEELKLDFVKISSTLPDWFANLSSLVTLSLGYTELRGYIPSSIFFLPKIETLDFGGNGDLKGAFPLGNWTNNVILTYLDLQGTGFRGKIPDSLGNLKSLSTLDLSNSNFSGSIPKSIGNLTEMTHLALSGNMLIGPIPSTLSNMKELNFLALQDCNLSGSIPKSIGNLTEMINLDLSNNKLIGPIPTTLTNMKKLFDLELSSNNLTEYIPSGLFELEDLWNVYVNDNALTGPIPSNASELQDLLMLHLDNNLLNGTLPPWLFALPSLVDLNLRGNHFTGKIHDFDSKSVLEVIDLGNNSLQGPIPRSVINLINLEYLILSYNNLDGPVPILPVNISYVLISHNKLTGVIPLSFCSLKRLIVLDVAHNDLSNKIPECFGNSSYYLETLDLQKNRFDGIIPSIYSKGLKTLNLNGNHFKGSVPKILAECQSLEVLDLGNNKLCGKFPHCLESLPQLKVLVLRSNQFYGRIKSSRSGALFPLLRIFDLSNNEFTGQLPETYIRKFIGMRNLSEDGITPRYMDDDFRSYKNSIELVMKGSSFELVRILTVFTTIDLSSNKFEGEIPDTISKLDSLRSLNLSHNNLYGHIPASLGNLTKLESLDLSHNKLTGEIPMTLMSLTSLGTLQLSNNHLVGRIPKGNQFDTFDKNSYADNPELCGLPLSKLCENTHGKKPLSQQVKEEEGSSFFDEFTWQFVMLGYGCGTVIGLVMGYLMFSLGRPRWFSNMFEKKPRRGGTKQVGFRR